MENELKPNHNKYYKAAFVWLIWLILLGALTYLYHLTEATAFNRAFADLVLCLFAYGSYSISYTEAKNAKLGTPQLYIKSIFYCLLFALVCAGVSGSNFEDFDTPLSDNEDLSSEQIINLAWRVFIVTYFSSLFAISKSRENLNK